MPARGRASTRATLVDTSVAVPFVVVDHQHHVAVSRVLRGQRVGLAGHAAFETFSVLTRLPPPLRRSAAAVTEVLDGSFPYSCYLSGQAASSLLGRLAASAVSGGAVYDALVGAAALEHGRLLVTRDGRAAVTYRALGVEFELMP